MRILLTGATGFLGSHLLKRLVDDGHSIVLLKRSTSDCCRICGCMDRCISYDIDRTAVEEVFRSHTVDVVVHCATAYGRAGGEVETVLESNLVFPLRLLEAAVQARTGYFFNTDTFFCKQLPERLERESPLYMPEYTLTKRQFHDWGRLRAAEGKICFVNLQLEHVYGPDDSSGKFIPSLTRRLWKGEETIALTDGIQIRDFIHIEDVVDAYLCVLRNLDSTAPYQSFEVGSGQPHTIRQLAETMKAASGGRSELCLGAVSRRKEEIMYSTADNRSLIALGWQVRHPFSPAEFTFTPPQNMGI